MINFYDRSLIDSSDSYIETKHTNNFVDLNSNPQPKSIKAEDVKYKAQAMACRLCVRTQMFLLSAVKYGKAFKFR